MKRGPIIIIDDDDDDVSIIEEVLNELNYGNEIIFFDNCTDAFDYLQTTEIQPFIILCDVKMPDVNGLEFKKQIDMNEELRKKSIPFIFYANSVNQHAVNLAYTKMTVQGFFKKKSNYLEIKNDIRLIFEYWMACVHPNTK